VLCAFSLGCVLLGCLSRGWIDNFHCKGMALRDFLRMV